MFLLQTLRQLGKESNTIFNEVEEMQKKIWEHQALLADRHDL